jgi:hypothetical protein
MATTGFEALHTEMVEDEEEVKITCADSVINIPQD